MGRMSIAILLAVALWAGSAAARPLALAQEAALRAGPGLRYRVIAALPAGTSVDVLRHGRVWTRVAVDGQRGYIAAVELVFHDAPRGVASGADDPACDYGYPYSGSGAYFTGLTALRHSEPLGYLLGFHRRWPC